MLVFGVFSVGRLGRSMPHRRSKAWMLKDAPKPSSALSLRSRGRALGLRCRYASGRNRQEGRPDRSVAYSASALSLWPGAKPCPDSSSQPAHRLSLLPKRLVIRTGPSVQKQTIATALPGPAGRRPLPPAANARRWRTPYRCKRCLSAFCGVGFGDERLVLYGKEARRPGRWRRDCAACGVPVASRLI